MAPTTRLGTDAGWGVFANRREAGRELAARLSTHGRRSDVVVLGLARGGVPVAWEVAVALQAPLDVFVVRKLGVPGQEELVLGALASGGRVVVNDDVVRAMRVTPQQLRDIAEREGRELIRREAAYRDGRPPLNVAGKTVILVDDGEATGARMTAAVQALRETEPAKIVVALPAAPDSTCRELARVVDDVVCAVTPTPFLAVGESFWDFARVGDEEVRRLLSTSTLGAGLHTTTNEPTPVDTIGNLAVEAPDGIPPLEALEAIVGNARIVLIGGSSEGTHEFHAARAAITKWLVQDKGFCAVAAEADRSDAYRVNRYVRGMSNDRCAEEALRGFERFPSWTLRNTVARDFVEWMREDNERRSEAGQCQIGVYGLDVYSTYQSMSEVVDLLDRVDATAAARARERYACFDHVAADDGQAPGFAAAFGAGLAGERQVVDQLVTMRRRSFLDLRGNGPLAEDDSFSAEQDARAERAARPYYRAMLGGRVTCRNLRDHHMAGTLEALLRHLSHHHETSPARIVVWAHNSHVGDARATEMGADAQVSLGQLVRERFGADVRIIGLTTHHGTVTAATGWGAPAECMTLQPALAGSIESLFHQTGRPAFVVSSLLGPEPVGPLDHVALHRAIGVVYRTATGRRSHYLHVRPADQFDAIIHVDQTRAVEPLGSSVIDVRRPGG